MPFALIGGTMWAASPSRYSLPWLIGLNTTHRRGTIRLSAIRPVGTSVPKRSCSSPQILSSGHCSVVSTWMCGHVSSPDRAPGSPFQGFLVCVVEPVPRVRRGGGVEFVFVGVRPRQR